MKLRKKNEEKVQSKIVTPVTKNNKSGVKLKSSKDIVKIIIISLMCILTVFSFFITQTEPIIKGLFGDNPQAINKTITQFQSERWNEIRNAVFGAGAQTSNVLDDNIANMSVQSGNPYFNWVNTASLGITPWNGSSSAVSNSTFTSETKAYSDTYTNGQTGVQTTETNNITYTVIPVSTAEQFKWALDTYKGSTNNIKISITKDIDLNGQSHNWQSVDIINSGKNGWLYIEGNGHTIYNMKNCQSGSTQGNGLFGTITNKSFIVKNLNIDSSLIVNTRGGTGEGSLRGTGVLLGTFNNTEQHGLYIDNVKIKEALIQTSDNTTAGGGGLVGRLNYGGHNDNYFISNSSTEKVYMAGIDHVGGFSGCINNPNKGAGYKVKYDAAFPVNPEAYFTKEVVFPTMLENCFSVDCEIFSTGKDSGAFISCGGHFIIRNCFTNNTIYANSETGVFIGKILARIYDDKPTDSTLYSDSLYDDAGVRSVSAYITNCYASGIIEGTHNIGGFVGITNYSGSTCTPVVIENCYSSSMVGMEYSGDAVGGFIGSDDSIPSGLSATIRVGDETITSTHDIFINCYATGEVGDITTNTENNASNTSTLGGFIGNYTTRATGVKLYNCYYDKQTTGMRERGIGYVSGNATGSIDGLEGVYTKGSSLKGGTPGLTGKSGNIVDMKDKEAWNLKDGLYPQLKVFEEASAFGEDNELVNCYSQASASTVFLEHWDYIMTKDNVPYNVETDEDFTPNPKAEENNYIYDTIRDITLSFEFTSNDNSEATYDDITWQIDTEMNRSRGFKENFTINYGSDTVFGESSETNKVLNIVNVQKDSNKMDPKLFDLMKELGEVKDIYKCYDFAPGKSWVKVQVKNDSGSVVGERKLRLLPMAYVYAGEYAEIVIDTDGTNRITYTSSDNVEQEYSGNIYKHRMDTVYATTSAENLGNQDGYASQEVSKDTNTKFAMWGRYPSAQNNGSISEGFDSLYDQKMIGDAQEGLTKVAVYKLDMEYVETTLSSGQVVQLPKINYDDATRVTEENLNNEKWTGTKPFGLKDVGWYELRYYWRLDDGRYLSDSKIVVIKGSEYTASLETQIVNNEVITTSSIEPDLKEGESNPNSLVFDGTNVNTVLQEDNTIVKTKTLESFGGEEVLMGWKNDGNYKLVNVQIEVSQDGVTWTPLALELKNPDNPYDFVDAKYTYLYQDYQMVQDPMTGQYYIMELDEPKEIDTTIVPITNAENPDYADYLHLQFQIKDSESGIKSIKSHVRVSAKFIPMDSHVIAEKFVDKENVLTGEEVEYTVLFTPDNFNNVYDVKATDVMPLNTNYIEESVEMGEYIKETNTYEKYSDNSNSSYSYDDASRTLSWMYNTMEYGKVYYLKFKVNATGAVDTSTQDFIKVDNVVNFTYKKSKYGKPVDGEPSKAATFIIVDKERVYLTITKDVTTPYAPKEKFPIKAKITKSGEEVNTYKWYIDYEISSNTTPNVEIEEGQVLMFVGREDLNDVQYKIEEDTGKMPQNFYLSSITNNGEGTFEEGKVKKIVVRNYYRLPEGKTNVYIEKRDIDTNEYVTSAKMKLQKQTAEEGWEDVDSWDSQESAKSELLTEGKYRVIEEEAPHIYELNETPVTFEVFESSNEDILVKNEEGLILENNVITFYNKEKPDGKVTVHHYLIDDNSTVSPDVVHNGKVGDTYETKKAEDILDKYEFVKVDGDEKGTMTESPIEVTYYYKLRVAKITSQKTQTIPEDRDYVLPGDKITYTITVTNSGNLGIDVKVKDKVPEGTTLVPDSIKIDETVQTGAGKTELEQGLTVNMPMAQDETPTVRKVSFDVTVNDLEPKELEQIKNMASIDTTPDNPDDEDQNTEEVTVDVKVRHITMAKTFEVPENVTVGDTIKYIITVTNDGDFTEEVTIKDEAPDGTTFKGNIVVNPEQAKTQYTEDELKNGITINIEAGQVATVSFEVTVNALEEADNHIKTVTNTATVSNNGNDETVTSEDIEVKEPKIEIKKTSDTPEKVKAGDTITYKITITNSGTLEDTVKVKDSAPNGTSFVSATLNSEMQEEKTFEESALAEGVDVTVKPEEVVEITFVVQVEAGILTDGQLIENTAQVGENTTETVTHKYIEALIESRKQAEIIDSKSEKYALVGDKIRYTIELTNNGGLTADALIKDTIPAGTSLVAGTIVVQPQQGSITQYTQEQLTNEGIRVTVPAKDGENAGMVKLTFDVLITENVANITNVATVNKNPDDPESPWNPTNDTNIPIVTFEKVSEVTRKEGNETESLESDEVTVGDTITYKIKVHNAGKDTVQNIEVKDTIPDGTDLLSTSEGAKQNGNEITWVIDSIKEGETKEVSFKVQVKYSQNNYQIQNVATVDGKNTNTTENDYRKPGTKVDSKLAKTGDDKIVSKETKVYYEIKYTTTIDNFKGRAKLTIVDKLPYKIDKDESELDKGEYDDANQTITWNIDENDIDTFETGEAKQIAVTKTLRLKFIYGSLDNNAGSMENLVTSTLQLQEPDLESPEGYKTVETQEDRATKETLIEIPASLIVHHYIYDAETDTLTTIRLADDEEKQGIVGQEYETKPSSEVPANYKCIKEDPEKYKGKYTEEEIEVKYYYQLQTPQVSSQMDKKSNIQNLTSKDGKIKYDITYTVNIADYIGKATVKIVDTLPARIDREKSKLNGGIYEEASNTITWNETINDIDTYKNGPYSEDIIKQIEIVYVDQDLKEDLTNKAEGTVEVYYPSEHSTKPGEKQVDSTSEDETTLKQKYDVKIKIQKTWDDNDDKKGHRPDSVKITLREKVTKKEIVVVLNKDNKWSKEIENLQKYDETTGEKLEYEVIEAEIHVGELEYYEEPEIIITEEETSDFTNYLINITNKYKLIKANLNSKITKTGTTEITKSSQAISYKIHYTSQITNYIGEGEVIIKDYLPYKIDEKQSKLANGTYDEATKTITWKEAIPHTNGSRDVDITKEITLVYKDIDPTAETITNNVTGEVKLNETEQHDEAQTKFNTNVNINGTVIVKYEDAETKLEIADREIITGKVGKSYTTKKVDIENYEYVGNSGNTEGKIIEGQQEVIYYYTRAEASVLVRYQDKDGKQLANDVVITGKVGDSYTTVQREFENYRLLRIEGDKEGTLTKETKEVIYIYEKIPAQVIVRHLERGTDKKLVEDEIINGSMGDTYQTERETIENYKSAEPEPTNKSGKMTEETIIVTYYYEKIPSGKLVVKYVDEDTKEEITYKKTLEDGTIEEKVYSYDINGFLGEQYTTDKKDIQYYVLTKVPENATGILTENSDTVIYYYRKMRFNLSIEKELKSVVLNGQEKNIPNKKATKIEIESGKIAQAQLDITYIIKVKNDGELDGKAKILELLPEGYKLINVGNYWAQLKDGNLETEVELKAGETKELEVTLRWVNGDDNFGVFENTVKIVDTENDAGFKDVDKNDNSSVAEVITTIKTGVEGKAILIVITTLLMTLFIVLYLYK